MTKPDFKTIATPLIDRGFRITPVNPETKRVSVKNFQNWQITTHEDVDRIAKSKYAHHIAGVVGKAGVGRDCFLDIDANGVLERIEQETGEKMPRTYTVCSRPTSAPYKRHFYFTQTEYSFKKFGGVNAKNINRRDTSQLVPSPSGGLMYPTQYDVKGIGGGAIVVAAGSPRQPDADGNVEYYTCIEDCERVPIPDWLVDWLIADKGVYKRELRRIQQKKFREKTRAGELSGDARAMLRAQGHSDGFDVFPEDRYAFLFRYAHKFAKFGVTGESLERLLREMAERYVEGGKAYVESVRGQESISKLAQSVSQQCESTVGNFYKLKSGTLVGLILVSPPCTKRDILRDCVRDFPDLISVTDADARLKEEMELNGFMFDKRKDKDALYDIRREEGFEVSSRYWRRLRGER
jgi:hypothetical protein